MLLLTQPRTYGGDSTQPHEPGTRAATRTETAVTTMEQPPPGAKAAVVPAGSEAAATVPKATAAVPEAAIFTGAYVHNPGTTRTHRRTYETVLPSCPKGL